MYKIVILCVMKDSASLTKLLNSCKGKDSHQHVVLHGMKHIFDVVFLIWGMQWVSKMKLWFLEKKKVFLVILRRHSHPEWSRERGGKQILHDHCGNTPACTKVKYVFITIDVKSSRKKKLILENNLYWRHDDVFVQLLNRDLWYHRMEKSKTIWLR